MVIDGVQSFHMASGVPLKALPAGTWLHRTPAKHTEGESRVGRGGRWGRRVASEEAGAAAPQAAVIWE